MLDKLTDMLSVWFDGVVAQVLVALTSFLIFFLIFSTRRQAKGNGQKCHQLPGPRGLPLVGYLPFVGSDLRWTFKDLAIMYGPIFKVRLGLKDCVVITSSSLAKEVLKDKDVTFANRTPTVAGKLAGFGALEIAFSDYGPEWRKMKKIFVSEMLGSANLEATSYLRKKEVNKMISKTYKRAGELVDIGELVFFTIFSSIMSMVWGNTLKGDEDNDASDKFDIEFRAIVADFIMLLGKPNASDYLPFLACFDLQGIRGKMKLVADRVENIFDLAIHNRFASKNNSQTDFLGYLLQLTELKDPAASLSLPQVKAILMDAIIGGMDTTATTVEWTMAELLKHPKIMRTVQEELAQTVGLNNTVEESHLPNLKYLNAVLKETLRLHPAVALLVPHRPSTTTTVGGYTVPTNSMVFVNAWAIHRDPNLWENPLEFQPERFLNGSENLDFFGKKTKYLPFGSGRRMCPGITLADKTSMFVLSSMLHSFDWKLPNGDGEVDLSETFALLLKKSTLTMAVPSPRLSSLELYSDEQPIL